MFGDLDPSFAMLAWSALTNMHVKLQVIGEY